MAQQKVLVVEDDADVAELLSSHLLQEGLIVVTAGDGADALARLQEQSFALAIIDRNLPDTDGIEICKHIRSVSSKTGVIILTCLDDTSQRVLGLTSGADDYVTKPFSIEELAARAHSVLRRTESTQKTNAVLLTAGDLLIDKRSRTVLLKGEELALRGTEFDLLVFLVENKGKKFSRTELLQQVWGYSFSGYEYTVNTHINRLRSKLGDDSSKPTYILTVWGVGYQFSDEL